MKGTQIFLKKHSPTILTVLGSTGVIITAVLAVKGTPKAMKLLEEAKNDKGDELTRIEAFKVAWTPYIPAAISALTTILCVAGANYLNVKKQQSMASAYILLQNTFDEYRRQVKEKFGADADYDIKKQMIEAQQYNIETLDDECLFFEFNSLRFFEANVHKVMQAECKALEQFKKYGHLSLNDYYSYLGISPAPYGEVIGWSQYQMETAQYEDALIFTYDKVVMSNGLVCWNIITNVEPTMDYFCF